MSPIRVVPVNSQIAGRLTLPATPTTGPIGGTKTVSPDSRRKSRARSPLNKKSYRSKVPIVRLLRISLIVRSDPSLLGPPAANRACTMVESELTVYTPGLGHFTDDKHLNAPQGA